MRPAKEILPKLHIFARTFYIDRMILLFDRLIYFYWIITFLNNVLLDRDNEGATLNSSYLLHAFEYIFGIIFTLHFALLLIVAKNT